MQMAKYVFGFYWRTVLYILCVSLVLSPFWFFLHGDTFLFAKKSINFFVMGGGLLLPVSKGKGVLYLLRGAVLSIEDINWVRYRKILGIIYILFSLIAYAIYLYQRFDVWVYFTVFGGAFVLWLLPLIVAFVGFFYETRSLSKYHTTSEK